MAETIFKSSAVDAWSIPLWTAVLGGLYGLAGWSILASGISRGFGVILLGVAIYNLVFLVRSWNKFGSVAVRADGVTISQNGSEQHFGWHEIRECSRVRFRPFVRGASQLYQLKYATSGLVTFFAPGYERPQAPSALGPYYQDMVELITKKTSAVRSN